MRKVLVFAMLIIGATFFSNITNAQNSKDGKASFYHNKFEGRKTATGETFRNSGYTAASNHFPLGTYVKVSNKKNGKVVYVKINDRMGHQGRVIDLTYRAAGDLNFINSGLTNVSIEVVNKEEGKRKVLAQTEYRGTPVNTGKSL